MLGRLPRRYRLAIWVAGLATFACLGVWLTLVAELAVLWSSAAVVGATLGILVVTGYLHLLEKDTGGRPAARGH